MTKAEIVKQWLSGRRQLPVVPRNDLQGRIDRAEAVLETVFKIKLEESDPVENQSVKGKRGHGAIAIMCVIAILGVFAAGLVSVMADAPAGNLWSVRDDVYVSSAKVLTVPALTVSGAVSFASGVIEVDDLETAAKTKTVVVPLGDVSASDNDYILVAPYACTISQISLVTESDATGTTMNAATNWTFTVSNVTQGGTNLLAATVSTVTNAISANTVYDLDPDQNLTLAADDVLQLQAVLTGGAGALTNAAVQVEYY